MFLANQDELNEKCIVAISWKKKEKGKIKIKFPHIYRVFAFIKDAGKIEMW